MRTIEAFQRIMHATCKLAMSYRHNGPSGAVPHSTTLIIEDYCKNLDFTKHYHPTFKKEVWDR